MASDDEAASYYDSEATSSANRNRNSAMLTLWTIGHSTRSAEELIALLRAQDIEALADVRRFPASRRHPQFNAGALQETLEAAGIVYAAFPDLGGRRPARKDSSNTAWRNESFRGYADYMETEDFRAALERLLEL